MRAWQWLAVICLLAFVSGFLASELSAGSADARLSIYSGAIWLLYVSVYCWMKVDARERSITPPPGAAPLIVGFFPVAIPYYLLGTRQGWHKVSSLALLGAYIVLALACAAAGELLSGAIAAISIEAQG